MTTTPCLRPLTIEPLWQYLFKVPAPSFGVDGLSDRAEDAQAAAVVLANERLVFVDKAEDWCELWGRQLGHEKGAQTHSPTLPCFINSRSAVGAV